MDKEFLVKCDKILDLLNIAKFDNVSISNQIKNSKVVIDFCKHLDELKKPKAMTTVAKKSKVKKNVSSKSK